MIRDDALLFNKGDLGVLLRNLEETVLKDVERYDGNLLLNTPTDDVCAYYLKRHEIEPVELAEDSKITADTQDVTVDTRRLPEGRWNYGEHQPTIVATAYSFFVPFTGDAELFNFRPSTFTINPPRAIIKGSNLVLTFVMLENETTDLKSIFNNELNNIRSHVRLLNSAVEGFKDRLPNVTRRAVDDKKARLLRAQGVAASLGFPMRRRDGAPSTYAAPIVRRKISPSPPTANSASFRPEPTLADAEYEHILTVMQNMALVLERSPSAFKTMGEEDLRQHFLVQLNGHYEGTATGETFNVEGKTDILVREGGKNVFIAECKFWTGPKGFHETIDQLLGYTSWRDTKTAIVLFNRDVVFSTVLAKVPDGLRTHSNFKRADKQSGDTQFRATLSHKSDPSRELIVTVLVFDVPR